MARKPVSDHELAAAWWTIVVEESPAPDAVRKSKQAILDALCSDIPPALWIRRFAAGDLQRYYFNTKAQDRAAVRQVEAAGLQMLIDWLAEKHNISKEQAKMKVMAMPMLKLKSVGALDQRLRRAKQARKKGDKN